MRATARRLGAAAATLLASSVAARASAEPPPHKTGPPPPSDAIELTAASGYAKSFGTTPGSLANHSSGGIGADVSVGVRVPSWGFALTGGYAEMNADRGSLLQTASGGVALTYHAAPSSRFDPYVRAGAGYRFVSDGTTKAHGLSLAQIFLGLDGRPSQSVAVGPVVGVELAAFPWADASSDGAIAPLHVLALAGVQGRFDLPTTEPTE